MNEQAIYSSIEQEIGRSLQQRYQLNGGQLDMAEVVKEATFTLAVNMILSQRKLREQTGGKLQFVPPQFAEHLFNGMNKALKKYFPDKYEQNHIDQIKIKYESLMSENNVEDIINKHVNDLWQDYSNNIL
ncbi:MAG: hypothetical protein ACJA08_002135 [Cyclobacteriaceae bacterium]|jgi:hypothetical protein